MDICFSSNVAEHVSEPWAMADEMVRVTKPGGLIVLSYTLWWGPFGGHETGPWHALGGEYAARRYLRKNGREPKNRYGVSLFKVGAADGLRWARRAPRTRTSSRRSPPLPPALGVVDGANPPGLREFLVSNLVLVMRKH